MDLFVKAKGFDNYSVCSNGDVIHIPTMSVLKKYINSSGYETVSMKSNNKKWKPVMVHQLMAVCFLNHKPNGQTIVVDHIDNDKTNNNLINLQLITQRENSNKENAVSKSGYKGVFWNNINNKWQVRPRILGSKHLLGYYDCPKNANKDYHQFCDFIDGQDKSNWTKETVKQKIKEYRSQSYFYINRYLK